MWLRSSVPWESVWGGDRQPKVGKEQVLFQLWPAGRKALDCLLQVWRGFVRAFGTWHPPSFPPVAPEPGFCTGECLDQSYGVCTVNYLCWVIIVMSRHPCLNTAPLLLMEKKDLFPKQVYFLTSKILEGLALREIVQRGGEFIQP